MYAANSIGQLTLFAFQLHISDEVRPIARCQIGRNPKDLTLC